MKQSQENAICLCGSTKFYEAFQEVRELEALKGSIVLLPDIFLHRPETILTLKEGEVLDVSEESLMRIHRGKIEAANTVLVIDVNGYIGKHTKEEITYASGLGIRIDFASAVYPDLKILKCPAFRADTTKSEDE